jgi:hypothetical protein
MTTTHTAVSPYRTLAVRIDGDKVYSANGAFLGDVEGMARLGWEFTPNA